MTPHTGILCCLLTRDSLTTTSNYHVLIDDAGIASCNAGRVVMKHMTALKQCWTFKAKNGKNVGPHIIDVIKYSIHESESKFKSQTVKSKPKSKSQSLESE